MIAFAIVVFSLVQLVLGALYLGLKHIRHVELPDTEAHARQLEQKAMEQELLQHWESAEHLYAAAKKVRTRLLHARKMLERADGDFLPLELICLVGTNSYEISHSRGYVEVDLRSTEQLGYGSQMWGQLKLPLEFADLVNQQRGRTVRVTLTASVATPQLQEAS